MTRDEKILAFENWYQNYILTHDVGNPSKYKEFAKWAFWGGLEYNTNENGKTCSCNCTGCLTCEGYDEND